MPDRETTPTATNLDLRTWHDNHYRRTSPETRPGWWDGFQDVPDPYNHGNRLSGWVQRAGGDQYGALVITQVNGRPAPQQVLGTPKASYPYRRDRAWLLERTGPVRSFLKYDGTNICQYSYHDADGNRFTSFKLRGRPFVPPRFQALLDRTLARYPEAARLKLTPGEAMVYELYGRNNPMLIEYPVDIELRALCRRNQDTGDIEPAGPADVNFSRLDCPLAQETPTSAWENAREEYLRRQSVYSGSLQPLLREGERTFLGHEGEMLYVRFPGGARSEPGAFTRLIKLKPPEIEEIHQASDFVPRSELEATARNIFETSDTPDLTGFIMMLAEDWSDEQIGRSMETAERVLNETLTRRAFEDRVLERFLERFEPPQFHSGPATVMRHLSTHYPKPEMRRVYRSLAARLPQAGTAPGGNP
jgi:hypothetical protein